MPFLPEFSQASSGRTVASDYSRYNDGYLPRPNFGSRRNDTNEDFSFSDASTLNRAAEKSEPTSFSIAGYNSAKSLIYGERDVGATYIDVIPYNGGLVFVCGIGHGVIDSLVTWTINNEPPQSGAQLIAFYRGEQTQTPDPYLVAAYAANGITWTTSGAGDAYAIVFVPDAGFYKGRPNIRFVVRGLRVYDPRDSSQLVSNPGTWKWSSNPSLCLADFLSSAWARQTNFRPRYGQYRNLDVPSVIDAANTNDRFIGTAPNTEIDRRVDIEWGSPDSDYVIEEAMRTYAAVFIDVLGSKTYLVPDVPRPVSWNLTDKNIKKHLYWRIRGTRDQPNWIEVYSTDTSKVPWSEKAAPPAIHPSIYTGAFRRSQQVRLPGITRATQAAREARRRMSTLRAAKTELGVEVFDFGLRARRGDVVSVTSKLGMTNKRYYIARIVALGYGRYEWHMLDYEPAVFDDSQILVNPTYTAIGEGTCTFVPPVQLSSVQSDRCVVGSGCVAGLAATWVHAPFPCLRHYEIRLLQNGAEIFSGYVGAPEFTYPALINGATYTFQVRIVSSIVSQNPQPYATATFTAKEPVCAAPQPREVLFVGSSDFNASGQLTGVTGTLSWPADEGCAIECWEVEWLCADGSVQGVPCGGNNTLPLVWSGVGSKIVGARVRAKSSASYSPYSEVKWAAATEPLSGRCFTANFTQEFAAGFCLVSSSAPATQQWTSATEYTTQTQTSSQVGVTVGMVPDVTPPTHSAVLQTYNSAGIRVSAPAEWLLWRQELGVNCP